MNNRKLNTNTIIISLLVVISSLLYYFYPSRYTRQIKKNAYRSGIQVLTQAPTPTPTIRAVGESTVTKVIRVIDGDTIVIEGGQKVRYIGVDAPEVHNPKVSQECFGKEAAAKNKELVLRKLVRLTKDVSETDKYRRLLRYVYVVASGSADLFVNEELVKSGFAHASTFPPDVSNAKRFVQLEREARKAKVGFWSFCQSKK